MVDDNINEGIVNENNPGQVEDQVEQLEEQEQLEAPSDNDENILIGFYKSKKFEVTTGDLINAGFNPLRIKAYEFRVGQFLLSRLNSQNPYIIEKI